jgi:hypothetical protein
VAEHHREYFERIHGRMTGMAERLEENCHTSAKSPDLIDAIRVDHIYYAVGEIHGSW